MAYDFLVMFSIPASRLERRAPRLQPDARGTNNERGDVLANRKNFTIQTFSVGTPAVTVNFGGACPFRARPGDACATVPVEWHSLNINPLDPDYKKVQTAKGTDQVTGFDQNGRWWLCDSDFNSSDSPHYVFTPFKK